jgi:hypothetical protein
MFYISGNAGLPSQFVCPEESRRIRAFLGGFLNLFFLHYVLSLPRESPQSEASAMLAVYNSGPNMYQSNLILYESPTAVPTETLPETP